jgi:hypothetical protein
VREDQAGDAGNHELATGGDSGPGSGPVTFRAYAGERVPASVDRASRNEHVVHIEAGHGAYSISRCNTGCACRGGSSLSMVTCCTTYGMESR